MKTFDYLNSTGALLTPVICNLLTAIHEYRGKQVLFCSFFQFKITHTPSLSLPLRSSIPIFFSIEISRSTVRGLTDNVSDIFLAVIVGDVLRIAIIFFWRSESSAAVMSPTSCADLCSPVDSYVVLCSPVDSLPTTSP